MAGFEPAASRPPDVHSNRAELHPEALKGLGYDKMSTLIPKRPKSMILLRFEDPRFSNGAWGRQENRGRAELHPVSDRRSFTHRRLTSAEALREGGRSGRWRIRTADLPVFFHFLWVVADSNRRPHVCQTCALNQLS